MDRATSKQIETARTASGQTVPPEARPEVDQTLGFVWDRSEQMVRERAEARYALRKARGELGATPEEERLLKDADWRDAEADFCEEVEKAARAIATEQRIIRGASQPSIFSTV